MNNVGLEEIYHLYKKYIKQILIITLCSALLSIIYSFFATPFYKSYVSIYPSNNDSSISKSLSGIKGFASSFGYDLSGSETNIFNIPDIINSRKLKKVIVSKNWNSDLYDYPIDLIEYWGINNKSFLSNFLSQKEASIAHLQNIAINRLSDLISVYEHESGLITISVLMEDPKIAADIVNYISKWIQIYVSDEMAFKATKNRIFIQEQVANAKKDLFTSEEALSDFQKKHLIVDDSPEIILARARLIRNIEVNQEVYIILRQQLELNKISELKEKPVLNILDNGDVATQKSKPLRTLILLSATFFSFIISGIIMYFYDGYNIKSSNS